MTIEMHSPDIGKLLEALSKAQGSMEGAVKDTSNPFFKSKYADLASVWSAARDPLAKNGLSISQVVWSLESQDLLITILGHSSGQWIKSMIPIKASKPDIQAFGSAITYCRRYALAALVGVSPEDDDGEASMDRSRKYDPATVAKEVANNKVVLNLPEEVDPKEFETFLKDSANSMNPKPTIELIRKRASEQLPKFLKSFEAWKEQNKKSNELVSKFEEFSSTV